MRISNNHTIEHFDECCRITCDSYSMRFSNRRPTLDYAFFRNVTIRHGIISFYSLTWRNEKKARTVEFYRNYKGEYEITIENKLFFGEHTYRETVLRQSAFYLGDAMRIIRKHYND